MIKLIRKKLKIHNTKNKFPVSDHCDGHVFFNPSGTKPKRFTDFLKWRFSNKRKSWPKWIENNSKPELACVINDDEIALTFINHVTFLIQTSGLNILTDPVFSNRVSPSRHIGPKRVRAPGLALEELPKIDLVLVSHNHYDHMDLPSIKHIAHTHQPLFIVPLGNSHFLKKVGALNVIEMDWWQSHSIQTINVTLVPAQHWSSRNLKDRNRALWGGFVLQTQKHQIYFAGDTGYSGHFQQIRERIGKVDIALLPIGAYEPRWFMQDQHLNPEDAVLAHIDLNAALSIGMHFGTFQLTDEGYDQPINDLKHALYKHNISNFSVLDVGQTLIYK